MPAPLLLLGLSAALAAPPDYEIPASVFAELRVLDSRFDTALAADCDDERCFSKGCAYVEHVVADKPRSGSLPGLGLDPGPGSASPQATLTRAQCTFAHEGAADGGDMQALSRRLGAKLSTGWTAVTVGHQALPPLPPYLREPPEPIEDSGLDEEIDEPSEAAAQPWTAAAPEQLWVELLPHFWWMIGLGLATLVGVLGVWSWRRVGRVSAEEQALLAQLSQPEAGAGGPVEVVEVTEEEGQDEAAFVRQQDAAWQARLSAMDPDAPDPELQALVRELLRAGQIPLLAKAVLRFPRHLPAAFPSGGDVAAAKLELAEALRRGEDGGLPDDAAFFRALNRHALHAALVSQPDARLVRSLREDFGAAGLAELIDRLPPRPGALILALSSPLRQRELVRLIPEDRAAALCRSLLRSNRLDPRETEALFHALQAAGAGEPLPELPDAGEVSDHGAAFDAAGALSALLPSLSAPARRAVLEEALRRFSGTLPSWTRGLLTPSMLGALGEEALADLFLSVELEPLAAWLSLVADEDREALLSPLPQALRRSIQASSTFPSPQRQAALAEQGRRALARGFSAQLARARVPFERSLLPPAPSPS